MSKLTWRQLLIYTAYFFAALASVGIAFTLYQWIKNSSDSPWEPLNVLASTAFSAISATASFVASRSNRKVFDKPITFLSSPPETLREANWQRNRENTLRNVESTWIKGYLKNAVHKSVEIELGLTYQPEAVSRTWGMILRRTGQENEPVPTNKSIYKIFKENGRSLLILGEPASGKTVTLLQLTESLIRKAQKDETQPIPLVLNLSSWGRERKPLVDWLVEEIFLQYQLARGLTRSWLEHGHVLLLLDGLDEVASEHRDDCIQAINEFKVHYVIEIVVCSRVQDYEQLNQRLNLPNAIVLQPLTVREMDRYLAKFGKSTRGIRAALAVAEGFQELAKSPLLLSLMPIAYGDLEQSVIATSASLEANRHQLLDIYIGRMFERRQLPANVGYTENQALQWLTNLAGGMSRHSQSIFYIERLQPNWLKDACEQWEYSGRAGLLITPIFTLIMMLFLLAITVPADFLINNLSGRDASRLLAGMSVILVGGLSIGILTGLLFTLETYYYRSKIELVEILRWSKSKAATFLVIAVFGGLVSGFISTQVGLRLGWLSNSLTFGFISGSVFGGLRSVEYRHLGAVVRGASVGLAAAAVYGGISLTLSELIDPSIVGLLGGLGFGLLLGLFGGTAFGLEFDEVERKITPNQGVWHSAKNALRVGVGAVFLGIISGFLVAILILTIGGKQISDLLSIAISITLDDSMIISSNMIVILTSGFVFGLFSLLLVGPVGGFRFGGRTIIRHLALRLTVSKKGYLPLDLVSFLDEMVGIILLRRVGGGWVFIHRYLLEHFASLREDSAS